MPRNEAAMKKGTKQAALSGLLVSTVLVLGYVQRQIPLGSAGPEVHGRKNRFDFAGRPVQPAGRCSRMRTP